MGNLFSTPYNQLTTFIFNYRARRTDAQRSRPDHPEQNSSEEFDLVTVNEQTDTSIGNVTEANTVAASKRCSPFYVACRTNNIRTVKRLLTTISQDEMDRVEPNGSTALHTASYHGYVDIVKLLLEAGADRSIRNKFSYIPFDEAANDRIKELFLRTPNRNRLVMNHGEIEWELIDDDVLDKAIEEKQLIKTIYDTVDIGKMFEKIETSYIGKGFANLSTIKIIKHFFQKATKTKDPIWIITAYTAETDFYNVLNAEIAGGASKYQNERRYIIALLTYHPKLNEFLYIGNSYRVMKVVDHDLKKYEINSLTMTKSFLSSSINEEIAVKFLERQEMKSKNKDSREKFNKNRQLIKSWVMCKYQIKHPRTALHIENRSQYVAEAEVLVMPYTVFKVKSKTVVVPSYLPNGQRMTIIEFEECDSYVETKIKET